jgi:hypothetical protein
MGFIGSPSPHHHQRLNFGWRQVVLKVGLQIRESIILICHPHVFRGHLHILAPPRLDWRHARVAQQPSPDADRRSRVVQRGLMPSAGKPAWAFPLPTTSNPREVAVKWSLRWPSGTADFPPQKSVPSALEASGMVSPMPALGGRQRVTMASCAVRDVSNQRHGMPCPRIHPSPHQAPRSVDRWSLWWSPCAWQGGSHVA